MTPHDPLKAVFDYLDRLIWIAHPSHGRLFHERQWLFYKVKEPIHCWAYLAGLTKEKPTSLYTAEDLRRLLEL